MRFACGLRIKMLTCVYPELRALMHMGTRQTGDSHVQHTRKRKLTLSQFRKSGSASEARRRATDAASRDRPARHTSKAHSRTISMQTHEIGMGL